MIPKMPSSKQVQQQQPQVVEAAKLKSVDQSKASIKPYEEEESYENPVNISKAPGFADDYGDIRSDYVGGNVNLSMGIGTGVNMSHDIDDPLI